MTNKILDKRQKLWYNKNSNKTNDENGHPLRCGCGKIIAFERNGCIYIKCRGCGHEEKLNILEP